MAWNHQQGGWGWSQRQDVYLIYPMTSDQNRNNGPPQMNPHRTHSTSTPHHTERPTAPQHSNIQQLPKPIASPTGYTTPTRKIQCTRFGSSNHPTTGLMRHHLKTTKSWDVRYSPTDQRPFTTPRGGGWPHQATKPDITLHPSTIWIDQSIQLLMYQTL